MSWVLSRERLESSCYRNFSVAEDSQSGLFARVDAIGEGQSLLRYEWQITANDGGTEGVVRGSF